MSGTYIRKQDAIDAIHCNIKITKRENAETVCKTIESFIDGIKSIEPTDVVPIESQEIGYGQCANAMLKMWIDNVVTDGEYNRIMDRLNKLYLSGGEREE